jgi:glutathione S-transferase
MDGSAFSKSDSEPPKMDPTGLTLHHLSSAQSLRIVWALEELHLPYTLKTYMRQKGQAPPELSNAFPLGNAPILEVNDPKLAPLTYPKPGVVTESRLIMQFLADNYANGAWTPKTQKDKIRNDYWQEFSGTTLSANVDGILVFDILPPNVPFIIRPLVRGLCNAVANVRKPSLEKRFALMEEALSSEEPWFAGKELGLADFSLSWPMDMASQRGYFNEKKYPKVAEWLGRIHERPAYKAAIAKGPSYNLVTFDMKGAL